MAANPLTSEQEAKLSEFIMFTSSDNGVARQFMEACSWNTEVAVNRYFANPNPSQFNISNGGSSVGASGIGASSSSSSSSTGNSQMDTDAALARSLAQGDGGGMGGGISNSSGGGMGGMGGMNPVAQAFSNGIMSMLGMNPQQMLAQQQAMQSGNNSREYIPNDISGVPNNGGSGGFGDDNGGIRAADAAFSEQLLPSGFDTSGTHNRRVQVKDSMKNFSNEWQQGSNGSNRNYRRSNNSGSNNSNRRGRAKQDQLAKMFAEPTYRFEGSLEEAKIKGQEKNAWILVNIQSADDFVSHCLNRDVWNDDDFKDIITSCFIFYQWTKEQSLGNKFINLYHINKIPCLCIIDPNTGRKEHEFTLPDSPQAVIKVKDEIIHFLDDHPNPKAKPKKVVPVAVPKPKPALSHEEQLLQQAMMASLQDAKEDEANAASANNSNNNNDNNSSNKDDDNDTEMGGTSNIANDPIGTDDNTEEKTDNNNNNNSNNSNSIGELEEEPAAMNRDATPIRIRMPGGEMLQRRFVKTSKVEQLYIYVYLTIGKEKGINFDNIHMFTPMPRTSLDDSKDKTFEQMGLIRATIVCNIDE